MVVNLVIRNWYLNFWACYLCLSWISNLHGFMWTWKDSRTCDSKCLKHFSFGIFDWWVFRSQIQLAGFPQDVHWPDEAETTGSKDGVELKEIFHLHLYCLFFLSFVLLLVLLHIVHLIYLPFSLFFVVYFLIYLIIYLYSFSDTRLFQIQLLYSHSDPMPPRSFLFS